MTKNYSHLELEDGIIIKTDDVSLTLEQTSTTYAGVDAVLASKQSFHVIVDSDGNDANTGGFTIRTNGSTVDSSSEIFKVAPTGELTISNAYNLPTADGANGTFLITDGDGQVFWGYQNDVSVANTLIEGTGVHLTSVANTDGWSISIGQPVEPTSNVIFNVITADLIGNVTGQVSDISNHTTSEVAEGSNLYFTTQRARDAVSNGYGLNYSSGQFSVNDLIAPKTYVDSNIASAIAPLAVLPRLTINLETSTGSITTSPVIANALSSIGNVNGYTINLGFGEYRETGPIVFNDKWQLQVVGPAAANTTAATIKNGVTIQNSNGVRFLRVQVEGTTSIQSRAGLGHQFERTQFMGNVTLSGTGGFMMFVDCEFAGNITIDAAFAGTIYFVRCSFSNASGVYTFSQTSALQAIIYESSGIPNTSIAKATFSGMTTYKAGTQAMFVNGLPLFMSGTTAQRPSSALTGFQYYDTTLSKPVWKNGSVWKDATGTTV